MWETRRVLILVKTYPQPSTKYKETVCTAGIDAQGNWLRLYPIQFRALPHEQQFRKFDWIEVRVERRTEDPRRESHRVDSESIRVVGKIPTRDWAERVRWVEQGLVSSVEELAGVQQDERYARSLAVIRPRIDAFELHEADPPDWTEDELNKLSGGGQMELFPEMFDRQTGGLLRKVPYVFHYRFTDACPECRGHRFQILDWEAYALCRRYLADGGSAVRRAMQAKFGEELPGRRDLYLILGTLRKRPETWTIVGLFYPPRPPTQMELPGV